VTYVFLLTGNSPLITGTVSHLLVKATCSGTATPARTVTIVVKDACMKELKAVWLVQILWQS